MSRGQDEVLRYCCSPTEVNVGVETLNLQRGHEGELARSGLSPSHDLVGRGREGGCLAQGQLRLHPVKDGEQALHSLLQLGRPVDTDLLQILIAVCLRNLNNSSSSAKPNLINFPSFE